MKTIEHDGTMGNDDDPNRIAFGDTGTLELKKQAHSANMNLLSY